MPLSVDSETDILAVGAGPTGLVLALWLAHMGVRVRIIDKTLFITASRITSARTARFCWAMPPIFTAPSAAKV
jgi:flavin-dependent dehydrogenase